jgi:cobalt-zinc-cadmium efflux system outer membrane protein
MSIRFVGLATGMWRSRLRYRFLADAGVAMAFFMGLAGCARFEARPLAPQQTAAEFEARTLDAPELKAFMEKNLKPQVIRWPPQEWDLHTLTWVAIFYHPSLDVARAQWGVTKAGRITAGQRPNPTLSLAPQYTTNAESGVSPWVVPVAVDIPFETAGKRGLRKAVAEHLSESARLSLAAQAWQVRSDLRAALLDHAVARRRVTSLQDVLDVQQRIVDLLEARLAAGAIAAPEVTAARVAVLKARTDLIEAKRQAVEDHARVAEALGLPLQALDGVTLTFDLSLSPEAGRDLESAEVRIQALHRRADILAALAEYAASQSALQLEIAKQYPDVTLGPGYEYDQGAHKWGLSVGAELPVFHHNQGPIAEAEARRTEAAARFLSLQAKVVAEIDQAVAGRAAVRDALGQIRTLLTTQRRQVQSIEAMVKAGGADQLDLASAQLEVRLTELASLDAVLKAQQALGRLEDAVQVPFEALPSVEQDGRALPRKEKKP